MELMLHRRLLHDDSLGVGEALNETQFGTGLVARGRLVLLHRWGLEGSRRGLEGSRRVLVFASRPAVSQNRRETLNVFVFECCQSKRAFLYNISLNINARGPIKKSFVLSNQNTQCIFYAYLTYLA